MLIPDARDIDHYCQQMIECPPTRLSGVPTLYQMIADHRLSAKIDFSHLRFAMCGAAPITGEDRKRIEGMLQEGRAAFVETEMYQDVHAMAPMTLGDVSDQARLRIRYG